MVLRNFYGSQKSSDQKISDQKSSDRKSSDGPTAVAENSDLRNYDVLGSAEITNRHYLSGAMQWSLF